MTIDQIDALARTVGCLPEAVTDIRSRVLARFQGEQPEPATVAQWLTETLKPQAQHLFPKAETVWGALGMDKATFDAMPPAWRLGQAMAQQARTTTPHPRRPVPREAPADVQAQWQDLPPAQRMTAYRQWRDGQGAPEDVRKAWADLPIEQQMTAYRA
jgi:hypothetical protein